MRVEKYTNNTSVKLHFFVTSPFAVRVHIWDLAGGSEYADVRSELYDGSHVVLLVYDVTSADTFRALDTWLEELATCCKTAPLLAVVANKVLPDITTVRFSADVYSDTVQRQCNERDLHRLMHRFGLINLMKCDICNYNTIHPSISVMVHS